MNSSELRARGLALFGVGWQARMSKEFGVSARTIRRAAAEDGSVPDWLEAKIDAYIGSVPPSHKKRDEWIIGDGAEGREYVIHSHSPIFIARILETLDDEEVQSEDADTLSGTTFDAGDLVLCEIDWVDGRPAEEVMRRLLNEAVEAIRNVC